MTPGFLLPAFARTNSVEMTVTVTGVTSFPRKRESISVNVVRTEDEGPVSVKSL